MINDPNLQTDGFINLETGMNSALPLNSLPPSSCALGLNVTFRGGKVATRPGLQQISLSNGLNNGLSYLDKYYQGACFYFNTLTGKQDRIVVATGGHILIIFLKDYRVNRLFPLADSGFADESFQNNALSENFFCQVEKYLVIQNGVDKPLIYDGNNLYKIGQGPTNSIGRTSSVPIGRQMAYNHGRLFVALQDGFQIAASDLNFSGSSEQINIISSEAGETDKKAKITTETAHNFGNGDSVFISGHSSEPDINNDGIGAAYIISREVNTAPNAFNIPKEITVAGKGGYVKKISSGRDSDALRFTEINYYNEGGTFTLSSAFGKITGLTFQSIGDVQSGQGDLIVLCEKGAASFSVSQNRSSWKSMSGFQKVLFPDIGCVSEKSLVNINSDIFWRAYDGIRSYTNARKDTNNSYGYIPISNQIRTIIEKDSPLYLNKTSASFFDNRLIVTISPKQDLRGIIDIKNTTVSKPVTFQGLAVIDFASLISSSSSKPVWEGMWVFGDILQIISSGVGPDERCFIFQQTLKPEEATNTTTLWELTKDSRYDTNSSGENLGVISVLETKSYSYASSYELKKLSRADLWLQEVDGRCEFKVYFRPDQYPCWVDWHEFLECSDNKSCVNADITLESFKPDGTETRYKQVIVFPVTNVVYFRLGYGPYSKDSTLNKVSGILQFGCEASEDIALKTSIKTALRQIGFNFDNGGEVQRAGEGTEWSPYIYTILTKNEYPKLSVYPTNDFLGSEGSVVSTLLPKDLQPQFRTQIRMPSPIDPPNEKACDPITKRPFRHGHEFQFRIRWQGYAKLNKFLAYVYPLVEQIGSDCP